VPASARKPPKIDQAVIDEIVRRLLKAAPPGSKVILFGSYARGEADDLSDVDLMVVEPEVEDPIAESIRLRRELRPVRAAMDILVASRAKFEYWRYTVNTIFYRAVREGKVHESQA
jgi:predicted nucleotidyltransferase